LELTEGAFFFVDPGVLEPFLVFGLAPLPEDAGVPERRAAEEDGPATDLRGLLVERGWLDDRERDLLVLFLIGNVNSCSKPSFFPNQVLTSTLTGLPLNGPSTEMDSKFHFGFNKCIPR
jgi:hypothetical protein